MSKPKPRGRFWSEDDIFNQHLAETLKPNDYAIYFCLKRHANAQGQCYPSYETLAYQCGMCRNTAIKSVQIDRV